MKVADLALRLQQLRPDADIIAVDNQGYHHAVESLAVGRELYPTIKLNLSPGAVPCDGVNSHPVGTRAERLHTILDDIEAHLMGATREVLTAEIMAIYAMLKRMAWPGSRPPGINFKPAVPALTSTVVNETCWKFIEAMPHRLSGEILNDLKPAMHEALKHYHQAVIQPTCNYPHCGCPFDHPGTEGWCAQDRPAAGS